MRNIIDSNEKKRMRKKGDGKIIGVPDSSSNVFGNKVC